MREQPLERAFIEAAVASGPRVGQADVACRLPRRTRRTPSASCRTSTSAKRPRGHRRRSEPKILLQRQRFQARARLCARMHKADDKIEVLNDFVQADVCGFFYDDSTLALPIQLKVTATRKKGKLEHVEV